MSEQSPVVQFVTMAVKESFAATAWARERSSYPRGEALRLAIQYGFRFEEDDIKDVYRGGASNWIDDLYCVAVGWKNISAAISIEHYLERKPFIFIGVKSKVDHSRMGWARKQRIALGSQFDWPCPKSGEVLRLTCTSFSDDQQSLTACGHDYVFDGVGGHRKIPNRRLKITYNMLMAERKRLSKSKATATGGGA